VGAPSAHSCGGAEEREKYDGVTATTFAHAVAPVLVAELYGEWRGNSISRCCAEQRRFRKVQVTRRDSVARRATFENWRFSAEQVFTPIIARAALQNRGSEHERALEFHPSELDVE